MSDEQPDQDARRWSRGIRDGDRRLLAEFYDAYFPRSLGAVRAMTGRDEGFCLDIVQEAMLKIVRAIGPMDNARRLDAWVLRVVRSTAIDALRGEARRKARERSRAGRESEGAASLVFDRREASAELARRLRALDDDDLELVAAASGAGPTLTQIAGVRGVSVDAVQSRARRVVQKLRREVSGDDTP